MSRGEGEPCVAIDFTGAKDYYSKEVLLKALTSDPKPYPYIDMEILYKK
ncbi:MAG TPA: hypothetical protein VFD60_07960 [Nitrososphaeraceae archaeon]|nr:hypothetical protein [Nitrososphaeraceae archaeon]